MSDWQQGDVIANGIRVHYYRTGAGDKPPVVLCHGFSDNGLCWLRVAQALEAKYDVIMIDARGHGLSEKPETGHDAKSRAADLAGLIQALGLKQPAVIGHSMGGSTTLQAAADFPELIGRAVLEDGGLFEFGPARPKQALREMFGWIYDLKAKTRDEIIAFGHAQSPTWDQAELGPWADSKLQLSLYTFESSSGPGDQEPWRQSILRVRCPMLVIFSDNDKGGMLTAATVAEAERLNPRVKGVHIGGAGHNIRREQFDAYIKAITAFLAER